MNVSNFESLLTYIDSIGDLYNPSRDCLKKDALKTLLDNTKKSFHSLYTAQSHYSLEVANRMIAFQPLSKLVTRIFSALLVMRSLSNMETERSQRNRMLYQPLTGIVDISIDIKNYIKSLFGASSHQFKQISKLHFKIRL